VRFINEHKQRSDGGLRWGVESICAVLSEHGTPIAPSTYYEAAAGAGADVVELEQVELRVRPDPDESQPPKGASRRNTGRSWQLTQKNQPGLYVLAVANVRVDDQRGVERRVVDRSCSGR
jgi:hypothetical protein